MYTNFRLRIRDFFKRNKTKIIIALIVWAIIFIINLILKNIKTPEVPSTSYAPHTAIMDNSEVPKKLQNPIEELIKTYIEHCNNKDYDSAYNMLSEDCRKALYPNKENFIAYVDKVFDEPKIYTIQNYSNVNDTYIYEVNIFEDILATGLTGEEKFSYYSEKFVIQDNKGDLSLAIREYIGTVENTQVYEDTYIKVEVKEVTQSYEMQKYKVKLTNRTDHTIVLADKTEKYEIMLELSEENRNLQNLPYRGVYLNPYETKETELEFVKFYDEEEEVKSIIFNAVRVLNSYSGTEATRQAELDNAVKLYSFKVML